MRPSFAPARNCAWPPWPPAGRSRWKRLACAPCARWPSCLETPISSLWWWLPPRNALRAGRRGARGREARGGGQAIHAHRGGSRRIDRSGREERLRAERVSEPPLGWRLSHGEALIAEGASWERCTTTRRATTASGRKSAPAGANFPAPAPRICYDLGPHLIEPGPATFRSAAGRLGGRFRAAPRRAGHRLLSPGARLRTHARSPVHHRSGAGGRAPTHTSASTATAAASSSTG